MLKEESLVTPERRRDLTCQDDVANKVASGPGELVSGAIVSKDFEKNRSRFNGGELV